MGVWFAIFGRLFSILLEHTFWEQTRLAGLFRERIWYNVYNMYDTCGKHLLLEAILYDNESTRTTFHN